MNCLQPVLLALVLSAATVLPAHANPGIPSDCPTLPAGSGLQWQPMQRDSFLLCRAADASGEALLNIMYTTREPDIALVRSMREEKGSFAGNELHWYRQQIAGDTPEHAALRRITVVKLGKRQHAQVWINASSTEQLLQLLSVTSQLPAPGGGLAGR